MSEKQGSIESIRRVFRNATPPRPQAGAEDVRRMVGYMFDCEDAEAKAAWQRIRASLGVKP